MAGLAEVMGAVQHLLKAALGKKRKRFAPAAVAVTEQDVELAAAYLNSSEVLRWVDTQVRNRCFWDPVLKAIGVTGHLEERNGDLVKPPEGENAAEDVKNTLCALIIALSSTQRPSPQDEVLAPFCRVVEPMLGAAHATDLYNGASKAAGKVNGPDSLRFEEIWVESAESDQETGPEFAALESEVVYRRDTITKVLKSVGYELDGDTAGLFVAKGKTEDDVDTHVPITDLCATIGGVMQKGKMSTLTTIVKAQQIQVQSPQPNKLGVVLTIDPDQNIWDVLRSVGHVDETIQFLAHGERNEDGATTGVVITNELKTFRDVMQSGNMRTLHSINRPFRVPLNHASCF